LLSALLSSSKTLEHLKINDNKSINRGCNELIELIRRCKNLKLLDISDLNMKRKNC